MTFSPHILSITTFIKLNNNKTRKSIGFSFRHQLCRYCIIYKHWCYHRFGSTSDAEHHVHHKSDHVVSQAIRLLGLILTFLLLYGQSPDAVIYFRSQNIVLCRLQLFPLTPLGLKASSRHSHLSVIIVFWSQHNHTNVVDHLKIHTLCVGRCHKDMLSLDNVYNAVINCHPLCANSKRQWLYFCLMLVHTTGTGSFAWG